jgi:hypothetical protein
MLQYRNLLEKKNELSLKILKKTKSCRLLGAELF